jgi:hypothetical protein
MFDSQPFLEFLQSQELPKAEVLALSLYQTGDLSLLAYFNNVYFAVRSLFLKEVQQFCESTEIETFITSPVNEDSLVWENLRVHLYLLRQAIAQAEKGLSDAS